MIYPWAFERYTKPSCPNDYFWTAGFVFVNIDVQTGHLDLIF